MFAYMETGGSNLDLPASAVTKEGNEISLERDVYEKYDIILCISTYSATAPLTAFAKRIGFRGATLHGVNDIILGSGLAVDYNEVSKDAEKLRLALTCADHFEIDFQYGNVTHTLKLECDQQEAQKSHGICLVDEPDVANLPAGEVYFVPTGGEGEFVMGVCGGFAAVELMRQGASPLEACRIVLERIDRTFSPTAEHQVAVIACSADGIHSSAALREGFRSAVGTPDGVRTVDPDLVLHPGT